MRNRLAAWVLAALLVLTPACGTAAEGDGDENGGENGGEQQEADDGGGEDQDDDE